jgi:hypothetical protein
MRRKRNDGLLILAVGLIVCLWAALRAAEQPPAAPVPSRDLAEGPGRVTREPGRSEAVLEADAINPETTGLEQDPSCERPR